MKTTNPRGSIFLLTIVLVIPLMLVLAGVAVDVAMLFATRSELHRAMDAAALAGAGKLGFDSSYFTGARQFAHDYAASNKFFQTRTISLDQNISNDPGGDIVLGIWDGTAQSFTPSLDGTLVNAVQCRTTQSIPTYFLNMVRLTSLSTSAESIAIAPAPAMPPVIQCPFPIAVCDPGAGACGQALIFQQPSVNTSGWIKGICGENNIRKEIDNAAAPGGNCSCPETSSVDVDMQNGENNGAYKEIADCRPSGCSGLFVDYYTSDVAKNITHQVCSEPQPDGSCPPDKIVYNGPGWQIYIPVIQCDGGPINGWHQVNKYSRFTVTEVWSYDKCAVINATVTNGKKGPWPKACGGAGDAPGITDPPGNKWIMYGYFECTSWYAPPSPVVTPPLSISTVLKLVR